MVRLFVILLGIAFIFTGVAGFLPNMMDGGLLYGYFYVDASQNIVHLVTGLLAIMAASSTEASQNFCKLCGLLYAFFAVCGFTGQSNWAFTNFNLADNVLNTAISTLTLYFGFAFKR